MLHGSQFNYIWVNFTHTHTHTKGQCTKSHRKLIISILTAIERTFCNLIMNENWSIYWICDFAWNNLFKDYCDS